MPSMEPTFTILEGSSAFPAASRNGRSCWVRKKGPLTLVSMTLSQPFSGKFSNGSPQATPALLISTSSLLSCSLNTSTNPLMPARLDRSAGIEAQVPPNCSCNRCAVASQASFLRELIYTLAPLARNPAAIISPIPREPPVTMTTLSLTENRLLKSGIFSLSDG